MKNKEFIELSEKKVKELNGSKHEESNEAWRSGYNYLAYKIRESMNNDDSDTFCNKMESIGNSELEVFKFNVNGF